MARRRKKAHNFVELLHRLEIHPEGNLAPQLEGYAYRFTIYLPLLSEGKEVFSTHHLKLLMDLFHARFGGFSATTAEGHPPWYGSWLPPESDQPVIDRHTLFVIYSAQLDEAKLFFQHLKWILQLKEVAQQEVVVIEHSTVWLLPSTPLPLEN